MESYAGMSPLAKAGWYILKGVGFIVASFVFSAIFWMTKIWIENCCKKPKKKR